jgi:hypothetical protein
MAETRKKTWKELIAALHRTFRSWGIKKYNITPADAPDRRDRYHSPEQRRVVVRFTYFNTNIVLSESRRATAHENLELLALAVETIRLSEARGVEPLLIAAYRQLAPQPMPPTPTPETPADTDPYTILGVAPSYPLPVIEAIWKAHLRAVHPDVSGSGNAFKAQTINAAMSEIRKRRSL